MAAPPDIVYQPGQVTPELALQLRGFLYDWAANDPDALYRRAVWHGCSDDRTRMLIGGLGRLLGNTDCVLWSDELWRAAIRGWESFQSGQMPNEVLPYRPQLWFLPGTMFEGSQSLLEVPDNCECDLILVHRVRGVKKPPAGAGVEYTGREGVLVTLIVSPTFTRSEVDPRVPEETLPYLRFLPPLYPADKICSTQEFVVAALSFLKQPFVQQEERRALTRQQSRAYERKNGSLPTVRIVTLRRTADHTTGASEATREWSCQWLVGGHWRRRSDKWNHGEGPIYVSPHLKGPPDKEFRAPRPTVFKVRR